MVSLASISSSSPPMVRRITRRPALERAPMGRGQIFGRGGFLGAKSAPCTLGGFVLSWVCDFGLKLDDRITMADGFIIVEDFRASLGRDEGKMVEGRREVIHFGPEPGPGEV